MDGSSNQPSYLKCPFSVELMGAGFGKCRGFPTIHISNFIHHLLLGLTATYTTDFSLYEPDVVEKGIDVRQWGQTPKPGNLTVKWHVPKREEVEFVAELFKVHGEKAIKRLKSLTDGTSIVKRGETGKEWSDEVSKNVDLLRLMISGMSMLFHIKRVSKNSNVAPPEAHGDTEMNEANGHVLEERIEKDQDLSLDGTDEDAIKPTFQYPVGYVLAELRRSTGCSLPRQLGGFYPPGCQHCHGPAQGYSLPGPIVMPAPLATAA
jgi:proteasome activator subunit 4